MLGVSQAFLPHMNASMHSGQPIKALTVTWRDLSSNHAYMPGRLLSTSSRNALITLSNSFLSYDASVSGWNKSATNVHPSVPPADLTRVLSNFGHVIVAAECITPLDEPIQCKHGWTCKRLEMYSNQDAASIAVYKQQ